MFFTLRTVSSALVTVLILFAFVVWPPNVLPICFFLACWLKVFLLWLQSLLFFFSFSCLSLLCRHVLFGFSPDELRSVPRVFIYLLNLCKFFVWHARNDFYFRDVRPGALEVIANIWARARFHLPVFFRRFRSPRRQRYFHRQWGASGTIGVC